jgi:endonuclease/exonuclease/phosphatase (EEP) superfamily protein YafD
MILRWFLVALGAVAIGVTALPLVPSEELWVRVWDFPRVQIATCLAVVLLATPLLFSLRRPPVLAFLVLVAVSLAWQLHRIWPYTPLVATEVEAASECAPHARLRLLVANVLIGNRRATPLLELVRSVDPDLVLLVETDLWWHEALAPLRDAYPHAMQLPQANGYGMHFFSRFDLIAPRLQFLIEDGVPSITTGLELPSGERIDFYGVHPKPPPLHDTDERDAELLLVAQAVRDGDPPAIVAGDLNDVAWSRLNNLFRSISGLLDPRIGRGPHSTFNANWPLMRWPLDHVFFEERFTLLELSVLDDIGSDHFPFFVALCHRPSAAAIQDEPQIQSGDREAASDAIEEGREAERK